LATEQTVNDLFLKLLRRHTDQGRNVTDKKGTSYAPAIFANEPEARESKTMSKMLAEAMTRLFAANKIKVVTEGPASKPRTKIVEVEAEPATIIPFPASRSTNASTTFQQPSTNLPPLSPHTPHDGGSGKGLGGSPPLPPSNEGKRFRV